MKQSPFPVRIRDIRTGRVQPLGPREVPSSIYKSSRSGSVTIGTLGLTGDEQGDRKNHGGPEKAINHYPFEHYRWWREQYPGLNKGEPFEGAFGENISTFGLTERDICIGDYLRLGTALVQVSQGRQPCWKLNVRFDDRRMARMVQETGRTGWYYRVLEEGFVAVGDRLTLEDRPNPDWSLARIGELLYRNPDDYDSLAQFANLPHLSDSWRTLANKRLKSRQVESWLSRLDGTQ